MSSKQKIMDKSKKKGSGNAKVTTAPKGRKPKTPRGTTKKTEKQEKVEDNMDNQNSKMDNPISEMDSQINDLVTNELQKQLPELFVNNPEMKKNVEEVAKNVIKEVFTDKKYQQVNQKYFEEFKKTSTSAIQDMRQSFSVVLEEEKQKIDTYQSTLEHDKVYLKDFRTEFNDMVPKVGATQKLATELANQVIELRNQIGELKQQLGKMPKSIQETDQQLADVNAQLSFAQTVGITITGCTVPVFGFLLYKVMNMKR